MYSSDPVIPVKKIVWTVILVLLLVSVVWVTFSSIRTVPTETIGVQTLFGKVVKDHDEGIKFVMPFSSMNIIPLQVQTSAFECSAFSEENQDVICNVKFAYFVSKKHVTVNEREGDSTISRTMPAAEYVFRKLHDEPKAWTAFIQPIIENALKELTVTYSITDVVNAREKIRADLMLRATQRMDEKLPGFDIKYIEIVTMEYGTQYKKLIEERNAVKQGTLKAEEKLKQVSNEAQVQVVEAKAKIDRAEADKQALIVNAEAAKQAKIIEAEAEAQKVVINAKADAEKAVVAAEAEAKAIMLRAEADAKAIQLKGDAEASVKSKIGAAYQGNWFLVLAEAAKQWCGKIPPLFHIEK